MEGKLIRIYATVGNHSQKDLLGVVRFLDNGNQIGADQAISIFKRATDGVFIDWSPNYGNHTIAVKIYPWIPEIDDPSNNWIKTDIYVIQDTDHDGIANEQDEDDDNDGVNDTEDAFPLNSGEQYDTDGDGVGDNTDTDDDNDDVPDEHDDLPLDPNETTDTDNDGIGNVKDTDDDNDGFSDAVEENLRTDPLDADTDDDGYIDSEDDFPVDSEEWLDTDDDKIGNNADTDDDNDGILDTDDEYPLNKAPKIVLADDDFKVALFGKKVFDASPSVDEDGQIVSFLWDIDGETKEGNSIIHTFEETGQDTVILTITDDNGESITKEFQVSVVNTAIYIQSLSLLLAILLALLIFFKYIAEAEKSKTS